MTEDTFDRLEAIFGEAKRLEGAARAAYLDAACAGSPELRARLGAMLAHHDAAETVGPEVGGRPARRRSSDRAAAPTPAIGDRLGDFEIIGVIGAGGMGTVYRAEQREPRRPVALKVIQGGAVRREAVERFRLEAETLGRLTHPNIARIHAAGTHEHPGGLVPYFAMELVEDGVPITQFVRERGLGRRARLELFREICDAVHHGHQKGVVHRDIKPANVLVDRSAVPRLIDFGIAKIVGDDPASAVRTGTGQLVGSLPSMSPEQCSGDPNAVDTRTDVYALGVLLYELLADRPPFDFSTVPVLEAVRRITDVEPPPPSAHDRSLRGDLDHIVGTAMAKAPDRRYESAAALARDVTHFLEGMPIAARPPSELYRLQRFVARNWLVVAAGSGAAVFSAMLVLMVVRPEGGAWAERFPWGLMIVVLLAIPASLFVLSVAIQLAARWVIGTRVRFVQSFLTVLIAMLLLLPVNAVQETVELLAPQTKPIPALLAIPIQFTVFGWVVGRRLGVGFGRGIAVWGAVCATGLAVAVLTGFVAVLLAIVARG